MPHTLPVSEYCQTTQLFQPLASDGQVTPQLATQSGLLLKAVEFTLPFQKPRAV